MGYCYQIKNSKFEIINEQLIKLLEEVYETNDMEMLIEDAGEHGFYLTVTQYPRERDYEIDEISQEGEKLRDQTEFLDKIAPYVTSGSFIECSGEEAEIWRWSFKDGRMKELKPTFIWPEG